MTGDVLTDRARTLDALLRERHSCRAFEVKPVPRELIAAMLELAQRSASWCNSQPWDVTITQGAGTERLRAALHERALEDARVGQNRFDPDLPFPAAYEGVYRERQRAVGWQLYSSVGIAHGDRVASGKQALENFRLFGAPHALILTSPRALGVYGVLDCGIYMGTLLLAAQSLGIAMVPQAALATYSSLIRETLNIPPDRDVVCGASFGFADRDHPANGFRSDRASLADATHWVEA
ncbi:nitroreductase (plasmid) [Sphingobium sp. JS3065]|uniref:nitroreductase n=1 Tax=Sphingobium sp. JS3065 TaxID=2970925 RepID=UPI00226512DA|nr:nitroreductase [Sphingobium sp. JS3065]UZW58280.1 nitroreductase [Sphingobium sp. JS3065]